MVATRKQNMHRANGKLLILQKQRRLDRFDQMFSSCWLVYLMLLELCTRNLFLLDKLWISNFVWRCWKDYTMLYGKNDQKRGAAVIGSVTTIMPLPTRAWVYSSFWQKKTWRLSLILFTWPCTMRLFRVPSYERPDERETFCWCQGSKKKMLDFLNISMEEFQKCF